MKTKIILAVAVFFVANSYAQITKGNWLVGGNASFSHTDNNSTSSSLFNNTTISFSPNLCYFISDKFCTGIKISSLQIKNDYPSNSGSGSISYSTKSRFYSIGPLVRYYFLEKDNRVNLLIEGAYQYQLRKDISPSSNSKMTANVFLINAGPVIYFNSSVGIEFTIGYASQKYIGMTGNNNTIQTSIGLQIHLRKDD